MFRLRWLKTSSFSSIALRLHVSQKKPTLSKLSATAQALLDNPKVCSTESVERALLQFWTGPRMIDELSGPELHSALLKAHQEQQENAQQASTTTTSSAATGKATGKGLGVPSRGVFFLNIKGNIANILCPQTQIQLASINLSNLKEDGGELDWDTVQGIVKASNFSTTGVFVLASGDDATRRGALILETALIAQGYDAHCRTSMGELCAATHQWEIPTIDPSHSEWYHADLRTVKDKLRLLTKQKDSSPKSTWWQIMWGCLSRTFSTQKRFLTPQCPQRSLPQRIIDTIAPTYPMYIVHLSSLGSGGMSFAAERLVMSPSDEFASSTYTTTGHVEDVMKLVLTLTAHIPAVFIPTPTTERSKLQMLAHAAARCNQRVLILFPSHIRPALASATASSSVYRYRQSLTEVLPESDFVREASRCTGWTCRKLVATPIKLEPKPLKSFKLIQQPVASAMEGNEGFTLVESSEDLAPVVSKWLSSISHPDRLSAQNTLLSSLKPLFVHYTYTQKTSYKREANPTTNVLTCLELTDDSTSPPLVASATATHSQFTLPPLDEFNLLVAHNAKTLLTLLGDDPELLRFLARGGQVWCCQYAEYFCSAFQFKSPHNTLHDISARHGIEQLTNESIQLLRLIYTEQAKQALQQHQLLPLVHRMKTIPAFSEMEVRGLHLDPKEAVAQGKAIQDELHSIEQLLACHLPKELPLKADFNWYSAVHLDALFFGGELRIGRPRRTWSVPTKEALFWVHLAHHCQHLKFLEDHTALKTLAKIIGITEHQREEKYLASLVGTYLDELSPKKAKSCRHVSESEMIRNGKDSQQPRQQQQKANPLSSESANSSESLPEMESIPLNELKPASNFRIILFDLETTGLSPELDKIVEVCFFDPVSNEVFQTLVNPRRKIPLETIEIHHISNDMVRGKPTFKKVARQLLAFLRQTPETVRPGEKLVLVAHSAASMDEPMLRSHFAAVGLELHPQNVAICDTIPILRSAVLSQRTSGRPPPSFGLNKLRQSLSIEQASYEGSGDGTLHRAEADTRLLWKVLTRALRMDHLEPDKQVILLLRAMVRSIARDGVRNCFNARGAIDYGEASYPVLPGLLRVKLMGTGRKDLRALVAAELRAAGTLVGNIRHIGPSVLQHLADVHELEVARLLMRRYTIESSLTSFLEQTPPVASETTSSLTGNNSSSKAGEGLSTKTDHRLTMLHPDNCVRQEVRLTNSATGRSASGLPNCQAIPKDDKSIVRKLFTSRFGSKGVMVEMDYSQLEILVLALLAQDNAMTKELCSGIDFHICRALFLHPDKSLTYDDLLQRYHAGDSEVKRLRDRAKKISFQRIYGAGSSLLARSSGLSEDVILKMVAEEQRVYPGIPRFYSLVSALCFRDNNPGLPTHYEAELPTGTRVAFSARDAKFGLPPLKNYPVQAYSAELVQMILGRIHHHLHTQHHYQNRVCLVNFVHDSLWFDCHQDVLKQLLNDIHPLMRSIPAMLKELYPGIIANLPFQVTIKVGRNMYNMKNHTNVEQTND